MPLTYKTVPEAYPALLQHVLTSGLPVSPRGQDTLEVIGASVCIADPSQNVVTSRERKLNLSFMAAEMTWILGGSNDARLIVPYNKRMGNYSDDGHTFTGSYGPKIAEQLPWLIQTLRNDPDSRQAVLTIWRERPGQSKDIPCTVAMQFFTRLRTRNGHTRRVVDMVTFMRSNDLWLGFPYDVFTFTCLQHYVASALDMNVGEYHHHVGSLHLYAHDQENARRVIQENLLDQPLVLTEAVPYPMPAHYLAMSTAVSLLGNRVGGAEDMMQWLDAGAWNITGFWGDMIELMGYRFHNQQTHLGSQYERLAQYHKGPLG